MMLTGGVASEENIRIAIITLIICLIISIGLAALIYKLSYKNWNLLPKALIIIGYFAVCIIAASLIVRLL